MQSPLFVLRRLCRRARGGKSSMVTQTEPGVIRAHEGCRVPHSLTCDTLRFSQFQNGGSKERRNEKKRPGRYCQKVATPRIGRPLSITPFSGTRTMLPRMWNRPGLRVDAPMKRKRRHSGGKDRRFSLAGLRLSGRASQGYVDLRHLSGHRNRDFGWRVVIFAPASPPPSRPPHRGRKVCSSPRDCRADPPWRTFDLSHVARVHRANGSS